MLAASSHIAEVAKNHSVSNVSAISFSKVERREEDKQLSLMGNVNVGLALLGAVTTGSFQEFERALARGADVDAADARDGCTPLQLAARDGNVKMVRFLLKNGAAVDVRNSYGATPLHFAASWGQHRAVRVLLIHGAGVNTPDGSGKTPIIRAAANGYVKVVKLLLKHGADASIRDAFGWSAERLAASAGYYRISIVHPFVDLPNGIRRFSPKISAASDGRDDASNPRKASGRDRSRSRPRVAMGNAGAKGAKGGSKDEFTFEDDGASPLVLSLRVNLQRLIVYARSADTTLQREVAEKLANEAVKRASCLLIVELDGLQLLLPLTKSKDTEVQRLAAHALANLSVNLDNKERIAKAGGIKPLINLASSRQIGVAVEAIAALANLAVNDANEVEIAREGGLKPIIDGAHSESVELQSQVARALRNLSVNRTSKPRTSASLAAAGTNSLQAIVELGGVEALQSLVRSTNDRICQQATRALVNLGVNVVD
ncbi:hypothetical protein BBJ28_00014064 [Nothophytophthora sp. Chile5]|nr:hypothetical protein BBJ28_00014064 [Nothophytophthora sp. Chile5]